MCVCVRERERKMEREVGKILFLQLRPTVPDMYFVSLNISNPLKLIVSL